MIRRYSHYGTASSEEGSIRVGTTIRKQLRGLGKRTARAIPTIATVVDYGLFKLSRLNESTFSVSRSERLLLRQIHDRGFTILPGYFSRDYCVRCVEDIESILEYRKEHVKRYSDLRVVGAEHLSPLLMQFAADPFLSRLSAAYMGAPTLNAFTLANKVEAYEGSRGSGEGWHKDSSFRQFKALLYLNEVTDDNGPVQLLERSHLLQDYLAHMRAASLPFRELRLSDAQLERILRLDPARLRTLAGPAGTLILADTACIHRGRPPSNGTRYALTNYYVEQWQVTDAFIETYAPVCPERIRERARALRP